MNSCQPRTHRATLEAVTALPGSRQPVAVDGSLPRRQVAPAVRKADLAGTAEGGPVAFLPQKGCHGAKGRTRQGCNAALGLERRAEPQKGVPERRPPRQCSSPWKYARTARGPVNARTRTHVAHSTGARIPRYILHRRSRVVARTRTSSTVRRGPGDASRPSTYDPQICSLMGSPGSTAFWVKSVSTRTSSMMIPPKPVAKSLAKTL